MSVRQKHNLSLLGTCTVRIKCVARNFAWAKVFSVSRQKLLSKCSLRVHISGPQPCIQRTCNFVLFQSNKTIYVFQETPKSGRDFAGDILCPDIFCFDRIKCEFLNNQINAPRSFYASDRLIRGFLLRDKNTWRRKKRKKHTFLLSKSTWLSDKRKIFNVPFCWIKKKQQIFFQFICGQQYTKVYWRFEMSNMYKRKVCFVWTKQLCSFDDCKKFAASCHVSDTSFGKHKLALTFFREDDTHPFFTKTLVLTTKQRNGVPCYEGICTNHSQVYLSLNQISVKRFHLCQNRLHFRSADGIDQKFFSLSFFFTFWAYIKEAIFLSPQQWYSMVSCLQSKFRYSECKRARAANEIPSNSIYHLGTCRFPKDMNFWMIEWLQTHLLQTFEELIMNRGTKYSQVLTHKT